MAAALTVLFFSTGHASAQDTLTVGQPVDRAIVAGATHDYPIALEAGDYVASAVVGQIHVWDNALGVNLGPAPPPPDRL